MINYENIAMAINYMQRINFCLKKFYLDGNKIEENSTRYEKIANYSMIQTINLFKNFSFLTSLVVSATLTQLLPSYNSMMYL